MSLAAFVGAVADAIRPPEPLSPSEFAERHRVLKPGAGPLSGPWRNDVFPYLVDVMDAPAEALREGKRGCVNMKSTQGGGTEGLGVNFTLWALVHSPGPILYLTSKDDVAKEFVRDRWDFASANCAPVARKALAGKANGELVQVKRFVDGKLVLTSSGSLLNLLSQPYLIVEVDEVDSIADAMPDGSDPIALIEGRMTAFREFRQTLIVAWAHPTTRERGAARLYFERSDQRRGHVECPHCRAWIAPRWDNVRAIAREGQSPAEAERDPSTYAFACPSCGAIWSDADRLKAIRKVVQRSTLPPEVAAKKEWVGTHFWQFFMPGKSVRELARLYVEALDDPATMRVFVNKVLGEAYEEKLQDSSIEAWASLSVDEGKPGSYAIGNVPHDVQFLTAGQDSRAEELHWAVWGWGVVRTLEQRTVLCGWLVDAGVEEGPRARNRAAVALEASDLFVFDQVLYGRYWPRIGEDEQLPVAQGFHDSGWQPTAVYEFCRERLERGAVPSKGAAVDDRSKAPLVAWKGSLRYVVAGVAVEAPQLRRADVNTFQAKCDLVGATAGGFRDARGVPRARLTLPHDVPEELLEHLASERLARDARGRRSWVKRGPNHWLDCTVLAYAAALNLRAVLSAEDELVPRGEALLQERAAHQRELEQRDAGPPSPADDPGVGRPRTGRIRSRYS